MLYFSKKINFVLYLQDTVLFRPRRATKSSFSRSPSTSPKQILAQGNFDTKKSSVRHANDLPSDGKKKSVQTSPFSLSQYMGGNGKGKY